MGVIAPYSYNLICLFHLPSLSLSLPFLLSIMYQYIQIGTGTECELWNHDGVIHQTDDDVLPQHSNDFPPSIRFSMETKFSHVYVPI